MPIQQACSFCGKPRKKVRDLIARKRLASACICDECIHVCRMILEDDRAEEPQNAYDRKEQPPSDPAQLRRSSRCSFCGQPQQYVRRLISSPSDGRKKEYICDRCVRTSERILRKAEDADLRRALSLAVWLKQAFRG